MQRPRTRKECIHELGYQQLCNRITACLGKLNKARAETAAHDTGILPKVQPISLLSPPKAYRDAARSQPFWRHLRRSEEHTSELQSLMRISYAVFCLKKTTLTD